MLARRVDRRLYPAAVKHLAENVASKLHRDSASSSAFPYFHICSFTLVLKAPSLHSLGRGEPPNWEARTWEYRQKGEPLKETTHLPHPYDVPRRSFATCPDLGSQGEAPILREQAASKWAFYLLRKGLWGP